MSLLDAAKAIPVKRRPRSVGRFPDSEILDLVWALGLGEITRRQFTGALEISHKNEIQYVGTVFLRAIREGLVKKA